MNSIEKISDKEYFSRDGLSNSYLIRFDRSPAHASVEFEETECMKKGSMLHSFILTPEAFDEEYSIAPADMPKDKRTAAYKEFAKTTDKEIIFKSELDELEKIKESVYRFKFENTELEDYLINSEKEISLFWDLFVGNKTVQCKAKADAIYIKGNNAIIFDIKKVQNCVDFHKSVLNYKYYRQANFYTTGLKYLMPKLTSIRFIFITIEDCYPYGVMSYELDDEFIYEGEKESFNSILKVLNWNGDTKTVYDNTTVKLQKPEWLCA